MVEAVLFDIDGVLTETANVHAAAWRRVFDECLESRAKEPDEPFRPFDAERDYREFVDGRPRYEGVESVLGSRGISLPHGTGADRQSFQSFHPAIDKHQIRCHGEGGPPKPSRDLPCRSFDDR